MTVRFAEPRGQLGDGQTAGRHLQDVEDAQPPIQGLRRLGGHAPSLGGRRRQEVLRAAHSRIWSIRPCSCSAVATAAGPPHCLRRAACVMPWARSGGTRRRPARSARAAGPAARGSTPRRRGPIPVPVRRPSASLPGRSAAAAAGRASGRARAGRECRGSPSPPPSRRAPPPRDRTAAVEEDPVEAGLGAEGLERELELGGGRLTGVGLVQQVLLRGEDVALVAHLALEDVVALDLHLGGEAEQRGHRRQEDRGGLATGPARTKRPTAWAKNSGVEVVVA